MKMLRILRLGLLLFAGISAGVTDAGTQMPPAREAAELRTSPNGADYGKFDGQGKLVFQELYQDNFPAQWHQTLAYYPYRSDQGVKLHRNVGAMNVFLAAEIRRPSTVRTFLREHLWYFLVSNLGDNGSTTATTIITLTSVNERIDRYLVKTDRRLSSPARRAQLKAKLQGYARSGNPEVAGNGWTMDINVVTAEGAVEHWLVKGRVMPMQIDSFLCEPREPSGTFQPMMLFH